MRTAQLFQGPFFEQILQQEPLRSAEYFRHGSSTMLFQSDGRLYRLTREGSGHNFLVETSASGNPHVTQIIRDYGPVAPSDEETGEYYYWLAEVEWLHDLDPQDAVTQRLQTVLSTLADEEGPISSPELPALSERCIEMAELHPDFATLLDTLAMAARFGHRAEADGDIRLDNIMRRPTTGELVLSAPLSGTYYRANDAQRTYLDALRNTLITAT
jgi:hypothetical protein